MTDISVGAVGAALIAGLVSLFGLIIGKEQKISEFRQIWIDELRKSIVSYLVNINSISDIIRLKAAEKTTDTSALIASYKALNEASYAIKLRINAKERPARKLLKSMSQIEDLFQSNKDITPENIRDIEYKFVSLSRSLLKFEWNRVKRGENIFIWTKRIIVISIFLMAILLSVSLFYKNKSIDATANQKKEIHLIEKIFNNIL